MIPDSVIIFMALVDLLVLMIVGYKLLKQQIDPWASREWDPANKELHYDSYEDLIDALEKYKEE